jgi:hypothetical protein
MLALGGRTEMRLPNGFIVRWILRSGGAGVKVQNRYRSSSNC